MKSTDPVPPAKAPIDVERESHPSAPHATVTPHAPTTPPVSVSPPFPPSPARVQPPAHAAPSPTIPAQVPTPVVPAPRVFVSDHSIDAMDAKRAEIAKLEKQVLKATAELDEMIRLHNLQPK